MTIINPNSIEKVIIKDKRKTENIVYKQIYTVSWLSRKLQFWKEIEPIYAYVYSHYAVEDEYITEEQIKRGEKIKVGWNEFNYIYDFNTKEVFIKPNIIISYTSGKYDAREFDTIEDLKNHYKDLIDSIPNKIIFN